jgi:hypothetical protein
VRVYFLKLFSAIPVVVASIPVVVASIQVVVVSIQVVVALNLVEVVALIYWRSCLAQRLVQVSIDCSHVE